MTSTGKISIAALSVAIAGAALWFGALAPGDRFAACRAMGGGALGSALGGEFTLTDENGARRTTAEIIDKPTLIYFGYTFCPDICPNDAANIGVAVDLLADKGQEVGSAFVSVDPGRDTPERLREFTSHMHPDMIGYSGSEAEVAQAAKAWRVYYARSGDDPEYYLMDHSAFTYLAAPDEGALTFFRQGTAPEEIAARTQCYVEALAD